MLEPLDPRDEHRRRRTGRLTGGALILYLLGLLGIVVWVIVQWARSGGGI